MQLLDSEQIEIADEYFRFRAINPLCAGDVFPSPAWQGQLCVPCAKGCRMWACSSSLGLCEHTETHVNTPRKTQELTGTHTNTWIHTGKYRNTHEYTQEHTQTGTHTNTWIYMGIHTNTRVGRVGGQSLMSGSSGRTAEERQSTQRKRKGNEESRVQSYLSLSVDSGKEGVVATTSCEF